MALTIENAVSPSLPNGGSASNHYLIGPVYDFLLLGGGSVIPLILVAFFWPAGSDISYLSGAMLLVANLVNHPHFAHSYQLFYRNFRNRAFGDAFNKELRLRYLFAAAVAPGMLIGFFGWCIASSDAVLLGKAVNLMLLMVGWHYVKQGYGMLMVDSALKRNFFSARDKQWLLLNAYSVWITSWLLGNRVFAEKNYWDLKFYTFGVPDWIMWAACAATLTTSALMLFVFYRKLSKGSVKSLPANGMIAYIVSLYVWLLVQHPAMIFVIPAFHSLQYLAVVWRYQLNLERANAAENRSLLAHRGPWAGFSLFLFVGVVLGYVGFWMAPGFLDQYLGYDRNVFGSNLFIFLFWVFINVHHYCLDNVMWRKDNPDTRKYLFEHAA